jgi:type I restriction enzyme S subunit
MAGEWKRTSLREADVTLIDCDHRTPPATDSGYPYVAIPQLKEGRIVLNDVRRISPEHFAEWTRKAKPQQHDVILSRRCNPGETAYVPAGLECALGQNLVLLRADGKKLFPPFLRWLVRGTDWWEQVGTFINVGAVFDSLKCADIPNFSMPLPPLAEQKAIATVLGALDDKIELNRRMNATLEAMARALFQSWFVDFNPVRAKLDGQKTDGLDPDTAALFPEHLEDSPLGRIPKGWEVKAVGDIGHVICGKTPPTSVADYYGEDVPFITIPDMHGNVFCAATARKLSHAGVNAQANKTLPPGSLCVSCIATPGLVVITSEDSQTNQQINSVVPHQKEETYFWYWVMIGLGAEIASSGSGGSVLVNLSKGRFETLQVIKPPHALIRAYHTTVRPLLEAILANTHQSRTLATLRDTLLPKLLSGELQPSRDLCQEQ